jgi:hypothetical protein
MRLSKLSQAGKDVQKEPSNGWIAFSKEDERVIA